MCSRCCSVPLLSSFSVAELNLSVFCPLRATMLLSVYYGFSILRTSCKCHLTVSVHFLPGFFPLHPGVSHIITCIRILFFLFFYPKAIYCLYIILLTCSSASRHLGYSPSVWKYYIFYIMKIEPCALWKVASTEVETRLYLGSAVWSGGEGEALSWDSFTFRSHTLSSSHPPCPSRILLVFPSTSGRRESSFCLKAQQAP